MVIARMKQARMKIAAGTKPEYTNSAAARLRGQAEGGPERENVVTNQVGPELFIFFLLPRTMVTFLRYPQLKFSNVVVVIVAVVGCSHPHPPADATIRAKQTRRHVGV